VRETQKAVKKTGSVKVMKDRLLTTTIVAGAAIGAALGASPALAQDAPKKKVEEVVITGSRIVRQDYVSNSPISTVSAETLANAGGITAETVLNSMPQFVPSVGSTSNNPGGSGAAQVDLRGLGVNRNLVLINGRRPMPSFSDGSVDINTIPSALIQKVEVISGGASAVYGADAIAGAVNFILKRNFQGLEFSSQYGKSFNNDAGSFALSGVLGGNFAEGKGNAVVAIDYASREEMNKSARAFASDATTATSFFPMGGYFTSGNAPTQGAIDTLFNGYDGSAAGAVKPNDVFAFNADGTLFNASSSPTTTVHNYLYGDEGGASDFFWTNGGANPEGAQRYSYNFEPPNKLILPLERTTITAMGEYNFSDTLQAYGSVNFTNYNATSSLAPSPAPTGDNFTNPAAGPFFTVPYDNPFVPDDLADLLASRAGDNPALDGSGATEDFLFRRRFLELGPRVSTNINNIWNIMLGMKGTFSNGWNWDVWASHGRFDKTEIQDGNVSVSRVEQLLDADDGGESLCEGGFNPFGLGTISAECADYVRVIAKNATYLEQDMIEASVNGSLFDLPAGTVAFAIGAQYRSNDYRFIPDQVLSTGDVAGFNSQQPLEGYIDSADLFGELFIPIIKDKPFAKELNLTLGMRYSDHSAIGGTLAYKAEGEWALNDYFRLRGSYQKAIRAPNINELFAPQDENNPQADDPCNFDSAARTGANGTQVTALCVAQAVAAGYSQGAAEALMATYQQGTDQIDAIVGGNPNLTEETANTYTIGVVFNSPWKDTILSSLRGSLDWYSIDLVDAIDAIDAQQGLSRCYDSNFNPDFSNTNYYCQLFTRSVVGEVSGFEQFSQNIGGLRTSGIDLQLDWRASLDQMGLPEGSGTLSMNFVLNWLNEFAKQPLPGDTFDDYTGTIFSNVGSAYPEWKWSLNTTWRRGKVSVTPQIRYIGQMENLAFIRDGDTEATGTPGTYYVDLAGTYDINDNWSVRLGINNLLDQEPRLYSPNVQANTDPQTFDIIGRRYFVGLKARF
jgi:outer membrane receptor protein involved in Fe transport